MDDNSFITRPKLDVSFSDYGSVKSASSAAMKVFPSANASAHAPVTLDSIAKSSLDDHSFHLHHHHQQRQGEEDMEQFKARVELPHEASPAGNDEEKQLNAYLQWLEQQHGGGGPAAAAKVGAEAGA
jgi:hypothetical protein